MPTPSDSRSLFPGALELMILRTLESRPLHGYALAQAIKAKSEDLLRIEEGSLYPALQRMLREGWLRADWGISDTNRRVRTYKLTAKGAKRLKTEIAGFEQMLKGVRLVLGGLNL